MTTSQQNRLPLDPTWYIIDAIAWKEGIPLSELARRAGVGTNTLQRSQRSGRSLKMSTVAAVLDAVGMTWADFAGLADQAAAGEMKLPTPRRGVERPHRHPRRETGAGNAAA